ncbi:MAG TPA: hypothetical protein VM141_06165 [Planctomycetota bacterium]|nr:hypothetical protein [Planctomycetota bacterium]
MAKVLVPPKNNVYTVMAIVTALVFIVGIALHASELGKYKVKTEIPSVIEPTIIGAEGVPAISSAPVGARIPEADVDVPVIDDDDDNEPEPADDDAPADDDDADADDDDVEADD